MSQPRASAVKAGEMIKQAARAKGHSHSPASRVAADDAAAPVAAAANNAAAAAAAAATVPIVATPSNVPALPALPVDDAAAADASDGAASNNQAAAQGKERGKEKHTGNRRSAAAVNKAAVSEDEDEGDDDENESSRVNPDKAGSDGDGGEGSADDSGGDEAASSDAAATIAKARLPPPSAADKSMMQAARDELAPDFVNEQCTHYTESSLEWYRNQFDIIDKLADTYIADGRFVHRDIYTSAQKHELERIFFIHMRLNLITHDREMQRIRNEAFKLHTALMGEAHASSTPSTITQMTQQATADYRKWRKQSLELLEFKQQQFLKWHQALHIECKKSAALAQAYIDEGKKEEAANAAALLAFDATNPIYADDDLHSAHASMSTSANPSIITPDRDTMNYLLARYSRHAGGRSIIAACSQLCYLPSSAQASHTQQVDAYLQFHRISVKHMQSVVAEGVYKGKKESKIILFDAYVRHCYVDSPAATNNVASAIASILSHIKSLSDLKARLPLIALAHEHNVRDASGTLKVDWPTMYEEVATTLNKNNSAAKDSSKKSDDNNNNNKTPKNNNNMSFANTAADTVKNNKRVAATNVAPQSTILLGGECALSFDQAAAAFRKRYRMKSTDAIKPTARCACHGFINTHPQQAPVNRAARDDPDRDLSVDTLRRASIVPFDEALPNHAYGILKGHLRQPLRCSSSDPIFALAPTPQARKYTYIRGDRVLFLGAIPGLQQRHPPCQLLV